MSATNYCAEYIEDSRKNSYDALPFMVKFNLDQIDRSIKFRLPDNGIILDVSKSPKLSVKDLPGVYGKYISVVRLPFDKVAVEFLHYVKDGENSGHFKAIVIARNNSMGGVSLNFCLKGKYNDSWLWSDMLVFIEPDFRIGLMRIPNSSSGDEVTSGEFTQDEQEFALRVTNVILNMMAALECSNSGTADIPASNMLNKKRIKKGKQPFFDYKVLTIDTKANSSKQKGGLSNGSTKRVHLRRGHIRRLADKTVWVNPCVVGDKSKGMITKDYKVI